MDISIWSIAMWTGAFKFLVLSRPMVWSIESFSGLLADVYDLTSAKRLIFLHPNHTFWDSYIFIELVKDTNSMLIFAIGFKDSI